MSIPPDRLVHMTYRLNISDHPLQSEGPHRQVGQTSNISFP